MLLGKNNELQCLSRLVWCIASLLGLSRVDSSLKRSLRIPILTTLVFKTWTWRVVRDRGTCKPTRLQKPQDKAGFSSSQSSKCSLSVCLSVSISLGAAILHNGNKFCWVLQETHPGRRIHLHCARRVVTTIFQRDKSACSSFPPMSLNLRNEVFFSPASLRLFLLLSRRERKTGVSSNKIGA